MKQAPCLFGPQDRQKYRIRVNKKKKNKCTLQERTLMKHAMTSRQEVNEQADDKTVCPRIQSLTTVNNNLVRLEWSKSDSVSTLHYNDQR